MLTVKGEEDVGVHTAQALKFELLSAYRDLASKHLELRAFTSDRGLHLDSTPQQYLHDFGSLLGDDRDGVHRNQVLAALLDDPGLLLRDPGQVGAQVLGVIEADRVITATCPSITLVASQRPPRPTSTTATSTGASAKAA